MLSSRRLTATLLAALLAAQTSHAAILPGAQNCGTVILPPGIGAGPGADVTAFNPQLADSLYNAEAADLLFMQLVWIAPDHSIDYSRSLVAAIASPDAGTTYNVTLRQWHWSDGAPVTAQDVLYTWNLAKSFGDFWPNNGSGGLPAIIKTFTITDDTHFTITLTRQVNPDWFILNGLVYLQPVPSHVWSHFTTDQIWQNQSNVQFFQVVDGPLIPQSLASGLQAVFIPNPHYEGPPLHLSRLIMKFMDSENAELQAVQSGDLDMANLPFPLFDKGQHLPGLHVVTLGPSYSYNEFIPNMANATSTYFADVRIRDALADAINQQQIIALAMHGQGIPVYNGIPPIPATYLSPAARAGIEPVGYNPAHARSLLASAGYTQGPDGILQKNGQRLAFTSLIPAGRPEDIVIAETLQQNFRAIGIEMKVREIEFNQLLSLLTNAPQRWQAIQDATTISPYPTGENSFLAGSFYDNNGYTNRQMDSDITASTDQPGLSGLYAYEDYAAAQQPVIFLPVEKYSILVRNGLHGVADFINPLGWWAPDALYCTAGAS